MGSLVVRNCVVPVLVLVAFAGSACRESRPIRPLKVPQEAVWIGGADGGVFVRLRTVPESHTVHADVYTDYTGDILYSGPLAMDPVGGSWPALNDASIYSFWDGENLYLKDGRRLVVVRKASSRTTGGS